MSARARKVYVSQEYAEGTVDRKRRMLESVARILSKKYGVIVVFSPTGECSTSTERMILPYEKNVDEALLLGMCGHETGHLRETDFSIREEIANYPSVMNRPLLFRIFNALEDVRIEIRMEEDYEGFKDLFRRMIPYIEEEKGRLIRRTQIKHWMQNRNWSKSKIADVLLKYDIKEEIAVKKACQEAGLSDQYTEREVNRVKEKLQTDIPVLTMILDVIYLHLRGYSTHWYPCEVVEFVADLEDVLNQTYSCSSSQEVLAVAAEVYTILEEAAKKENFGPNGRNRKKQAPGLESKEEGNEEVNVGSGRRIKIGSRVHHLHDPSKMGTVIEIKDDGQEIIVSWD